MKIKRGDRFERRVVLNQGIDYVHLPTGKKRERWWFQCDCGSILLREASNVKSSARYGYGCCIECVWCIIAAGELPRRLRLLLQKRKRN